MKRTGSVTTSENSPKMRGVTSSHMSGSMHVADRAAEGDAAHRRRLDEEDLADEDVAARELGDEAVQERDVLRLQRVPPAGSTPTTRPSLKKTAHSSLSTVSCEYMGTF